MSSSLLLFPQRFGRYVLRSSSGVCWLQASNNTRILNACARLWLTELEQATHGDSIKDVVRSSVKSPEFDKHLKNAGGHIGRSVMEITIKMKTIVRKPFIIKNILFYMHNCILLYILWKRKLLGAKNFQKI